MYILCRNREKVFAAASEHIFMFKQMCGCSFVYSMLFKERASANVLLLKDANVRLLLKENVQLISFVYVAASGNISMFFNERATASEKIFNDCF